jgi:L-aspartate oxidase
MDHSPHDLIESSANVVIVGAGVAGLFCALKLAPHPVTLVSIAPLDGNVSTAWAQGGIAAAVADGDSAEAHVADMITSGGGLVDQSIAHGIAREAGARIADLLADGVAFDRDRNGQLAVSRATGHSARRVVHVRGDMTGHAIVAALTQAARTTPSIRIIEGYAAESLLINDGAVSGLQLRQVNDAAARPVAIAARAVVLATGGIGRLYAATTNPLHADGSGLAIAARAGAVIADPEFVQFHPTAMMVGRDPAPPVTEALRCKGAILVNRRGQRFMLPRHPLVDLAPRDIVARGVGAEIAAGRGAFLDVREVLGDDFAEEFPMLHANCREVGIDPTRQPIPIAPAAHAHMGGIAVDAHGRTSLEGLWAAGEVASTGAGGANELTANALIEAVVTAARVAEDIAGRTMAAPPPLLCDAAGMDVHGPIPPFAEKQLREMMSAQVGLVRDDERLAEAVLAFAKLERESTNLALRNMATTALLVAASAWSRRESRGAHYRADYPAENAAFAMRTMTTLPAAREVADQIAARPPRLTLRTMSA